MTCFNLFNKISRCNYWISNLTCAVVKDSNKYFDNQESIFQIYARHMINWTKGLFHFTYCFLESKISLTYCLGKHSNQLCLFKSVKNFYHQEEAKAVLTLTKEYPQHKFTLTFSCKVIYFFILLFENKQTILVNLILVTFTLILPLTFTFMV